MEDLLSYFTLSYNWNSSTTNNVNYNEATKRTGFKSVKMITGILTVTKQQP